MEELGDVAGRKVLICGCATIVAFVTIIALLCSMATLAPTTYGLKYNSWTGYVDTSTLYHSGRYLVGPGKRFIEFPASAITLEFSDDHDGNSPPIDARTGPDPTDPDSGGQPIKFWLSFQYKLNPDAIGHIYRTFSTSYNARYLQYVRQAVSIVAQHFDPSQYWLNRTDVVNAMRTAVAHSLGADGSATLINFQLMRIDFARKYEDTILAIQLAVQTRTTREYEQDVTRVLKDIDIMSAKANSTTTVIGADADARATLIVNGAQAHGFNLTQAAKAVSYRSLLDTFAFNSSQLVKWLRVKTIRGHSSNNLVMGMQAPVSQA